MMTKLHLQRVADLANSPERRTILRQYRIDPTSRLRFADAAAAAGVTTDEILAQIDAAERRQARRARAVAVTADAFTLEPVEYELEEALV